jgi:carbon monoxide dehydrogenase subunit G
MARYTTTVESTWSPEDAFAYLADFSNARRWDPATLESERVGDDGPLAVGARFRLVVAFLGRRVPLEYRIVELDPASGRVVLETDAPRVHGRDEITVQPAGVGSRVGYDAEVRIPGRLGALADPLLGIAFRRMASGAADGLRRELVR